jgi:hypothetical protein
MIPTMGHSGKDKTKKEGGKEGQREKWRGGAQRTSQGSEYIA